MIGKEGSSLESIVGEIKRHTRRKFTAEEKIRIILGGLRGEAGITDLCRMISRTPVASLSMPSPLPIQIPRSDRT